MSRTGIKTHVFETNWGSRGGWGGERERGC